MFPVTCIKKKSPGQLVKLLITLFKLNITFYFKCYLHHNYSINLNWNNTQLYSFSKPLPSVPSSVFSFVNFCFLPFLCKTSIQKWKKIWSSYAHKWIGKKEMSAKISKCLCRNLFIGAATQIRAVYKDHEILVTFERCTTLSFKFKTRNTKFPVFYDYTYENIFRLFGDSANKTKAFNLKVNCKELRLVFVHHVNTECT